MAKRRKNRISGQWAARSIELLEAPAYRVLSLSAHRALSRIEVEFAHHGGQDNGKLPVTFDDFERYGVHRTAIGPALTELETLGFVEITERGKMARAAEYRRPNMFRLTTREEQEGVGPERCRWRRFKTLEEAEAVAVAARNRGKTQARKVEKFKSCQYGKRTGGQYGNRTMAAKSPVRKPYHYK